MYVSTIKEKDSKKDTSSNLSRDGIFRLSIGILKKTYEEKFGATPNRPLKGEIIDTGHDFTRTNVLMPHPIYAWMSWVCVLSPTQDLFEAVYPLIVEAHKNAIYKFARKINSL